MKNISKCPKCKSKNICITQYKWYVHYYNSVSGSNRHCQSSVIGCLCCCYEWRTAAKYVETLKTQGKIAIHEKRNIQKREENIKKMHREEWPK